VFEFILFPYFHFCFVIFTASHACEGGFLLARVCAVAMLTEGAPAVGGD
jgi:hypothetical protein